MAYQNNIPLATDNLSKSQVDLNNNFQWLGSIAGNGTNNSSAINSVSNGFNYIYLPVNGANPPAGTAFATDTALFTFLNATTTKNELYVHKQVNGGQARIPLTASTLSNSTPGSLGSGYTYLPSGIILVWGGPVLISNTVNTVVTMPFTMPNQILNIQITPSGLGNSPTVTGQVSINGVAALNQFNARAQGANNINIFYLVVGY